MSITRIATTMAFIEVSMLSWTTDLGLVRKGKRGGEGMGGEGRRLEGRGSDGRGREWEGRVE